MPNRATIDDVTRMFESVGVPVDPAGMAVVCSAGQQRSSWHVRVPADKVSAACSVKACGVNRINVVPVGRAAFAPSGPCTASWFTGVLCVQEAQSFFDKALQRDGVSKHQWTVSLAGLPNNVSKGDVREFLERHGFESGSFSRVTVYSRYAVRLRCARLCKCGR